MGNNGGFKMSGLTIAGGCLALIGLVTIIWGATLYPMSFFNSQFMAYVVGGLILISLGISIISEIPGAIKIAVLWIATLSVLTYIFGLKMDLLVKLISFIPFIGFAAWITTKFLK